MRDLPHLRLTDTQAAYSYTARVGGGGGEYDRPPRDRATHAAKLKSDFDTAEQSAAAAGFGPEDARLLTYEIALLSPRHGELVERLEREISGIRLLSVTQLEDRLKAVVRVPAQKRQIILAMLERYATQLHWKSGRPVSQDLIENINAVRMTVLRDFWTDSASFPDAGANIWWEVWLFGGNDAPDATHAQFATQAGGAGIQVKPAWIGFPDRVVTLAKGRAADWLDNSRLLLHVAELRKAKELATDYATASPDFQGELVAELIGRMVPPPENAPAVCLLDTGVNFGHPLVAVALSEADANAAYGHWSADDSHQHQHGTAMAGVAIFDDLAEAFVSNGAIRVRHRLESVKILMPGEETPPELYGHVCQAGVARATVAAPDRTRVVCLAATADYRDGGLPSSWSAAIDQLCVNNSGSPHLVCVAAGNLRSQICAPGFAYPLTAGVDAGIEDPGQSWNALTVGAFTERVAIESPDFQGYQPLAPSGDISPTSRTSLAWPEEAQRGWPLKPDIVMEGGNWAVDQDGHVSTIDDLSLLTTKLSDAGGLLTTTHDTSPATASAGRMAAQIVAEYPGLRPETVRALIVHSAQWTPAMLERFPGEARAAVQRRLRCYGYGRPSLNRALFSAQNAATLVYEGTLVPYRLDGATVKSNEMHLHRLPWPIEVLGNLGPAPVTMRVTLSYFVEPSPGRRGWTKRHRYASHGLRFAVKRPLETEEAFLDHFSSSWSEGASEGSVGRQGDGVPWIVGSQGRRQGSLHSDWWVGTGAQLAACGALLVYPVSGWWQERRHLGRWDSPANYSLVVGIETGETDAALYAAIEAEAAVVPVVAA